MDYEQSTLVHCFPLSLAFLRWISSPPNNVQSYRHWAGHSVSNTTAQTCSHSLSVSPMHALGDKHKRYWIVTPVNEDARVTLQ